MCNKNTCSRKPNNYTRTRSINNEETIFPVTMENTTNAEIRSTRQYMKVSKIAISSEPPPISLTMQRLMNHSIIKKFYIEKQLIML